MQSYQIVEWGKPVEGREYPTPRPQGTEVLLKVMYCGVCHSDLHILDGYFDLGGGKRFSLDERGVKLPMTLGHEPLGEVVALGPEAKGVAVGDRRLVYPWVGCGECAWCKKDQNLLCGKPRTVGTRRDGGYSDHVIVPHPRWLFDYSGIKPEYACTLACSGLTAYSAVKKHAAVGADESVLIVGAGGVGLAGVGLARTVLKAKLIVADTDPAKRAAARQAGAHEVIDNASPGALERVREISGGGVAGAIDFVGRPATGQFGLDSLRKGGKLVVVGLYGDELAVSMPLFPLAMRTIQGSYVGSLEEMRELLDIAKSGRQVPIPITIRPLREAAKVLDELRAGQVLGRIVLQP
jgi:D-arabinose 1-dehydrogenase-like Zn-dependent alcohol dehydrogenase